MEPVRRYTDEMRAQDAARVLRAHGIAAEVVGEHTQPMMAIGVLGRMWTGYDVIVLTRDDRARAEAVLREHDRTMPELEEGWEEEASLVDLSALDEEAHGVSCPACGEWLGLRDDLVRCPACGEAVDVVELVVRRHGPEVLGGAGGESEEMVELIRSGAASHTAALCEECGRDLSGLARRGRCPECGRLYDKDEMRGGRVR